MATEELKISVTELQDGDKVKEIGIFRSQYSGSPVRKVIHNEVNGIVSFNIGSSASMSLSSDWRVVVDREKEKLAQYYFKNHSMKEEKLVGPYSQLYKNASVIIYDGKVIKQPE